MHKVTDRQIETVLAQTGGLIAPAARQLGVTRNAIYKRVRENPDLRDLLDEIRESHIDFAEGQLLGKIREGHPACIMFFLRTIGKSRGYVERVQGDLRVEQVPQKPLNLPPPVEDYRQWQQQRAVNPVAAGEAEDAIITEED
tara:strand:- start:1201 stop:1626 length:426 start_codon:yes stop_codon:yes gene_type:complete